jgi:hypothetical protein
MNNNPESTKKLVMAFLQFYGSPSLAQPVSVCNVVEIFQILRLLQFMVTHKASSQPVKAEEDKKKRRTRTRTSPRRRSA